jgi:hydroxymethylglutaryl-CoA synthase
MGNWWDFFKPELASEYPSVDGPLTLHSYIGGLEQSYENYIAKEKRREAKSSSSTKSVTNGNGAAHSNGSINGHAEEETYATNVKDFDYICFHGPYGKLVQKGTARLVSSGRRGHLLLEICPAHYALSISDADALSFATAFPQMYLDYLSNPDAPQFADVNPDFKDMPRSKSILNKECEKTFVGLSSSVYKGAVYPTTQCLRRLGNMYTAAVYGALASVIDDVEPSSLLGKRIALFSFGSGLAASFFTVRVRGDTSKIRNTLKLKERLAEMEIRTPEEFVSALKVSPDYIRHVAYSFA